MTTLADAQAKLNEALLAESSALLAKETHLTSAAGITRRDVQQDLSEIAKRVSYWRGEVVRLTAVSNGQPLFAGMTFSSANFGNTCGRE